ncbi:MAG: protein kinase, partial [Myxococcota bacterium]
FISPLDTNSPARERFLVEARASARLQHPNVVAIYRVGEYEHRPFIISEFIRGQSLSKIKRPLPWRRVLDIGIGLARGLAAAHRQGILHRDIKPANAILSEEGTVKILDFGLAKFLEISKSSNPMVPLSELNGSGDEPDPQPPFEAGGDGLEAIGENEGKAETTDVRAFEATLQLEAKHARSIRSSTSTSAEMSPESSGEPSGDEKTGEATVARFDGPDEVAPEDGHNTAGLTRMPMRASSGSDRPGLLSWGSDLADSNLTPAAPSGLWGTPLYLSPEQWLGKPASRRSDVYSLGVVLYELCVGDAPFAEYALRDLGSIVVERDIPALATVVDDVPADFAAVVDRCLSRDPEQRFASADELRDALEQLVATGPAAAIVPEGNPYRGLLAFEAEHRALFFGRNAEIRTLVERLRSRSFVLVAGGSGVGKSSLCRAGVMPNILDGALDDGRMWKALTLVPGVSPIAELAQALEPLLGKTTEQIAEQLRANPYKFVHTVQEHLGPKKGLLLFIDQFEELVTISDPAEQEVIGELVCYLAEQSGSLRLLATVRGDFLSRLAAVPGLGDELAQALYLCRPMSSERVREAIVGPVRAKGVFFESDALIDMLVDSTDQAEGGLPLLQFALAELWDARSS